MTKLPKCVYALALLLVANFTQASGLDKFSTGDASASVREALTKGADYAVSSLGKQNGFLQNGKVRIPLPDSLKRAEKGMRMLGMGKRADELVVTMNEACARIPWKPAAIC